MSKIKQNYLFNLLYQFLAIILPFVTTPYISRILGVENIGEYSYGYSVAHYFALFAHLGINNYGSREIAKVSEDKDKRDALFCSIFGFQVINASFFLILYCAYCCLGAKKTDIAWIFSMMVCASIFDVTWFFYGTEKFKLVVVRNAIVKIISTIGVFVFVKDEADLWKYCFIIAVSSLLSQVVLWSNIFTQINKIKISMGNVLRHIKPCLVLFIPVIAISLYKYMDKIMLGILAGNVELGYYENAEKINQLPVIFIMSLGTVMLPRVSNLIASGEKNKVRDYTNNSIMFAMFLSSALCFGLMAISKEFVLLFLGEGYLNCAKILDILLLSSLFVAIANVIRTQLLLPKNRDLVYVLSVICGALINFVTNSLLINILGAIGAAVGTLLAEFIVCFIQIFLLRKEEKYVFKSIIQGSPFLVAGIIMYYVLQFHFCSLLPGVLGLILRIVVGAMVYLLISGIYCACIVQWIKFRKLCKKI